MKKKRVLVLAIVAFLLLSSLSAAAQVRLDVDVPVLIAAGLKLSSLTGDTSGGFDFDLTGWHIPLPCIELAFQFGEDVFVGGVGLRTYTLLVEFAGWPMAYAELYLKPIVLRAEIGGFAFFLLGIYNQFTLNEYTMKVLIPDVQASWAITDWFRLGAGVLAVAPLGNFNNFGWMFYINGRLALVFK